MTIDICIHEGPLLLIILAAILSGVAIGMLWSFSLSKKERDNG